MTDPYPFSLAVDDADTILETWGKRLVCAAAPSVTVGLTDRELVERPVGESSTLARQIVLKVKSGAFEGLKVIGTRVSITDRSNRTLEYTIDQPVPQGESLFDAYALQPYRT